MMVYIDIATGRAVSQTPETAAEYSNETGGKLVPTNFDEDTWNMLEPDVRGEIADAIISRERPKFSFRNFLAGLWHSMAYMFRNPGDTVFRNSGVFLKKCALPVFIISVIACIASVSGMMKMAAVFSDPYYGSIGWKIKIRTIFAAAFMILLSYIGSCIIYAVGSFIDEKEHPKTPKEQH